MTYNFDLVYHKTLETLLCHGETSYPRGQKCTELLNYRISIEDLSDDARITWRKLTDRQAIYNKYLEEEHKWYLSGNLKASSAPSKFWLKLADKDGNITSNYGHMVFFDKKIPTSGRGNITSFDYVTQLLSVDPDSRQAIIHYGHPALFWEGQKDVPCACHQQFFIRHNQLHCITTMRSQDVWRGMVYDVPWFVYVQKMVCKEVSRLLGREIGMGDYLHNVGSLHIYEANVQDAMTEIDMASPF